MITHPDVLVVGAGPAGLMAADVAASNGASVLVIEAKATVGRKLLMAGKSGLNLTNNQHIDDFVRAFGINPALDRSVRKFGPGRVQAWVRRLKHEIFTGSTGQVFPKSMKASPLLRTWLEHLATLPIETKTRCVWQGWHEGGHKIQSPDGVEIVRPKAVVFAFGGASWARLGSDGNWAGAFNDAGIPCAPFLPSNVGVVVDWSDKISSQIGAPIKNVRWSVGANANRGDAVISASGLEGGGIYKLSPDLRSGAELSLDLMPDRTVGEIEKLLDATARKQSLSNRLRRAMKLSPVKIGLLYEWAKPLPAGNQGLAEIIKALPVPYRGTQPLDQAISVAGGVQFAGLDEDFMLLTHPGHFCAGEMLDWEAPTGGFLLTGCLATGKTAGIAAAKWSTAV
jgi:uncharacterized flavoprotein (TIGR03862 family)